MFFPGGEAKSAVWDAAARKADLAILYVSANSKTPFTGVADVPLRKGDTITQSGYPSLGKEIGQRQVRRTGRIMGFARHVDPDAGDDQEDYLLSFRPIPGDSGSGIFNNHGHLAGVVWGYYLTDYGRAVSHYEVVAFLKECCPWALPRKQQPKQKPEPKPDVPPRWEPIEVQQIKQEIEGIRKEVEKIGRQPGPPGKEGAQGPPGKDGIPGKDIDPALVETFKEKIKRQAEWFSLIEDLVGKIHGKLDPVLPIAEKTTTIMGWLPWLIGGAATGGVGVPVMVGLSLFRGFLRRRRATARTHLVIRDSEPLPQVVRHESTYVPVEVTPKELTALQEAMDFLAKRNPGMLDNIELIKNTAKQIESGLKS